MVPKRQPDRLAKAVRAGEMCTAAGPLRTGTICKRIARGLTNERDDHDDLREPRLMSKEGIVQTESTVGHSLPF